MLAQLEAGVVGVARSWAEPPEARNHMELRRQEERRGRGEVCQQVDSLSAAKVQCPLLNRAARSQQHAGSPQLFNIPLVTLLGPQWHPSQAVQAHV